MENNHFTQVVDSTSGDCSEVEETQGSEIVSQMRVDNEELQSGWSNLSKLTSKDQGRAVVQQISVGCQTTELLEHPMYKFPPELQTCDLMSMTCQSTSPRYIEGNISNLDEPNREKLLEFKPVNLKCINQPRAEIHRRNTSEESVCKLHAASPFQEDRKKIVRRSTSFSGTTTRSWSDVSLYRKSQTHSSTYLWKPNNTGPCVRSVATQTISWCVAIEMRKVEGDSHQFSVRKQRSSPALRIAPSPCQLVRSNSSVSNEEKLSTCLPKPEDDEILTTLPRVFQKGTSALEISTKPEQSGKVVFPERSKQQFTLCRQEDASSEHGILLTKKLSTKNLYMEKSSTFPVRRDNDSLPERVRVSQQVASSQQNIVQSTHMLFLNPSLPTDDHPALHQHLVEPRETLAVSSSVVFEALTEKFLRETSEIINKPNQCDGDPLPERSTHRAPLALQEPSSYRRITPPVNEDSTPNTSSADENSTSNSSVVSDEHTFIMDYFTKPQETIRWVQNVSHTNVREVVHTFQDETKITIEMTMKQRDTNQSARTEKPRCLCPYTAKPPRPMVQDLRINADNEQSQSEPQVSVTGSDLNASFYVSDESEQEDCDPCQRCRYQARLVELEAPLNWSICTHSTLNSSDVSLKSNPSLSEESDGSYCHTPKPPRDMVRYIRVYEDNEQGERNPQFFTRESNLIMPDAITHGNTSHFQSSQQRPPFYQTITTSPFSSSITNTVDSMSSSSVTTDEQQSTLDYTDGSVSHSNVDGSVTPTFQNTTNLIFDLTNESEQGDCDSLCEGNRYQVCLVELEAALDWRIVQPESTHTTLDSSDGSLSNPSALSVKHQCLHCHTPKPPREMVRYIRVCEDDEQCERNPQLFARQSSIEASMEPSAVTATTESGSFQFPLSQQHVFNANVVPLKHKVASLDISIGKMWAESSKSMDEKQDARKNLTELKRPLKYIQFCSKTLTFKIVYDYNPGNSNLTTGIVNTPDQHNDDPFPEGSRQRLPLVLHHGTEPLVCEPQIPDTTTSSMSVSSEPSYEEQFSLNCEAELKKIEQQIINLSNKEMHSKLTQTCSEDTNANGRTPSNSDNSDSGVLPHEIQDQATLVAPPSALDDHILLSESDHLSLNADTDIPSSVSSVSTNEVPLTPSHSAESQEVLSDEHIASHSDEYEVEVQTFEESNLSGKPSTISNNSDSCTLAHESQNKITLLAPQAALDEHIIPFKSNHLSLDADIDISRSISSVSTNEEPLTLSLSAESREVLSDEHIASHSDEYEVEVQSFEEDDMPSPSEPSSLDGDTENSSSWSTISTDDEPLPLNYLTESQEMIRDVSYFSHSDVYDVEIQTFEEESNLSGRVSPTSDNDDSSCTLSQKDSDHITLIAPQAAVDGGVIPSASDPLNVDSYTDTSSSVWTNDKPLTPNQNIRDLEECELVSESFQVEDSTRNPEKSDCEVLSEGGRLNLPSRSVQCKVSPFEILALNSNNEVLMSYHDDEIYYCARAPLSGALEVAKSSVQNPIEPSAVELLKLDTNPVRSKSDISIQVKPQEIVDNVCNALDSDIESDNIAMETDSDSGSLLSVTDNEHTLANYYQVEPRVTIPCVVRIPQIEGDELVTKQYETFSNRSISLFGTTRRREQFEPRPVSCYELLLQMGRKQHLNLNTSHLEGASSESSEPLPSEPSTSNTISLRSRIDVLSLNKLIWTEKNISSMYFLEGTAMELFKRIHMPPELYSMIQRWRQRWRQTNTLLESDLQHNNRAEEIELPTVNMLTSSCLAIEYGVTNIDVQLMAASQCMVPISCFTQVEHELTPLNHDSENPISTSVPLGESKCPNTITQLPVIATTTCNTTMDINNDIRNVPFIEQTVLKPIINQYLRDSNEPSVSQAVISDSSKPNNQDIVVQDVSRHAERSSKQWINSYSYTNQTHTQSAAKRKLPNSRTSQSKKATSTQPRKSFSIVPTKALNLTNIKTRSKDNSAYTQTALCSSVDNRRLLSQEIEPNIDPILNSAYPKDNSSDINSTENATECMASNLPPSSVDNERLLSQEIEPNIDPILNLAYSKDNSSDINLTENATECMASNLPPSSVDNERLLSQEIEPTIDPILNLAYSKDNSSDINSTENATECMASNLPPSSVDYERLLSQEIEPEIDPVLNSAYPKDSSSDIHSTENATECMASNLPPSSVDNERFLSQGIEPNIDPIFNSAYPKDNSSYFYSTENATECMASNLPPSSVDNERLLSQEIEPNIDPILNLAYSKDDSSDINSIENATECMASNLPPSYVDKEGLLSQEIKVDPSIVPIVDFNDTKKWSDPDDNCTWYTTKSAKNITRHMKKAGTASVTHKLNKSPVLDKTTIALEVPTFASKRHIEWSDPYDNCTWYSQSTDKQNKGKSAPNTYRKQGNAFGAVRTIVPTQGVAEIAQPTSFQQAGVLENFRVMNAKHEHVQRNDDKAKLAPTSELSDAATPMTTNLSQHIECHGMDIKKLPASHEKICLKHEEVLLGNSNSSPVTTADQIESGGNSMNPDCDKTIRSGFEKVQGTHQDRVSHIPHAVPSKHDDNSNLATKQDKDKPSLDNREEVTPGGSKSSTPINWDVFGTASSYLENLWLGHAYSELYDPEYPGSVRERQRIEAARSGVNVLQRVLNPPEDQKDEQHKSSSNP